MNEKPIETHELTLAEVEKIHGKGSPHQHLDPTPHKVFECDHDLAWAPYILTSDPPQQPWICRICLQEGVERLGPKSSPELESYVKVKTRKRDSVVKNPKHE